MWDFFVLMLLWWGLSCTLGYVLHCLKPIPILLLSCCYVYGLLSMLLLRCLLQLCLMLRAFGVPVPSLCLLRDYCYHYEVPCSGLYCSCPWLGGCLALFLLLDYVPLSLDGFGSITSLDVGFTVWVHFYSFGILGVGGAWARYYICIGIGWFMCASCNPFGYSLCCQSLVPCHDGYVGMAGVSGWCLWDWVLRHWLLGLCGVLRLGKMG